MIRALSSTSIALGAVDCFFGVVAISGAVDDVGEGFGQLIAVFVILLLLSTALPPILRRLQPPAAAAEPASRYAGAPPPLAAEVLAAADRIEALNGDPGNRAPEISRECERLRQLARSHSR